MKPISVFEHEPIPGPLSEREKAVLDRLRGPHGEKMFEIGWRQRALAVACSTTAGTANALGSRRGILY
jgi:hypothetical protein